MKKKPVLVIGAGDVGKALIKRLTDKDYDINLYNRSDISIENIKSKPLSSVKEDIGNFEIIVVAAASEQSFFDESHLPGNNYLIFDLAIPRNLPHEIKDSKNTNVLTLDELSGMVDENLKGRESAVKKAENLISINSDQEFVKLKNRKNLNTAQKKFHQEQIEIREKAIDSAMNKISSGEKVEKIIEELADEIASKNAFHVSKILDESLSGKKRGS